MTARSDIHVVWPLSPRIVVVESPSEDLECQDLVDTLAEVESELGALDDRRIVESSGKQDLGGGLLVGVTVLLHDAQVQFQSRTASKSEGTATTASSDGTKLIDSVATFLADGVEPGACIMNFADRSVTTVLSVDSEIQLTCEPLADGADDQFEIGDAYKVWNVVQCDVFGGNLAAVDAAEAELTPIFPSAFTQVVRRAASSGTIAELEIVNLQRLIEMHRPHHTGTGNLWYWDPYAGDDGNDGTLPTRGVKTFVRAQELAVDYNHDVIFCIPGDPSGTTVTTESLEITKSYLFIRGPGRDFRIIPSDDTKPAVRFAPGCEGAELSGCVVRSASTGSQPALLIDGADFALLQDLWVENSVAEGVRIEGGVHTCLTACGIRNCVGDGLFVGDDVTHLHITGLHVDDCGGDGIDLAGSNIEGVSMEGHVEIHDNGGWGIRIGSGTTRVCLPSDTLAVVRNTLGAILDNGAETEMCGAIAREKVVDKTWDEALVGHESAGTAGAALGLLRDTEGGRWQIIAGSPFPQMVFYKPDNATELFRFDLKDKDGSPIDLDKVLIHDRVRVP